MKKRMPVINSKKFIYLSIAATAACVVLINVERVVAQDWPQWRGPNRDGKISGFTAPEKWPTNLVQKWTTPVGKGDSSPALVGEKLYAFGRQDADEVVRCDGYRLLGLPVTRRSVSL